MEFKETCLCMIVLAAVFLFIIPNAEAGSCLVRSGGEVKVNFTCDGGCCITGDKGIHCCGGEEGVGFGMGYGAPNNQQVITTMKPVKTTSGGETTTHLPTFWFVSLVSLASVSPYFFQ